MAEQLAQILDGMEFGVGKAVKLCGLLTLWEKAVDERVARNTEAIKIRDRVLYISASSPAWAQELSFLKKGFIDRFNQAAGKQVIRDIKFSAGSCLSADRGGSALGRRSGG